MKEREILEKSINEHQEAIDKARSRLADLETTYSIGDRFIVQEDLGKHILVSFEPDMVVMISLSSGTRHCAPKKVNSLRKITQAELNQICKCEITRYWDSQKEIRT